MMCIRALEQEWRGLSPQMPTQLHRWAQVYAGPAAHRLGHGCLDEMLTSIADEPDPLLWLLLRADRDDVPLAGRIVLQAMLPKVYAMARRDAYASVDDYVVHLWLRIRTFPLHRRRRIAANLALDTLKAVKAEQRHRTEIADGRLESHGSPPGSDEVNAHELLRAATELGLLDPDLAGILTTVYADGLSGRDAAQRHRVSPANIRRRCRVGVRRLCAAREELMDAVA